MDRGLILQRLLDKYEKSKHLRQPGVSNRRVMLRTEQGELPEYRYETAEIRDRFNQAAQGLERDGLVRVEYVQGRPVIAVIVLNLDRVDQAYQAANRTHPAETAAEICALIQEGLAEIKTEWIQAWRDCTCQEIEQTWRIPAFYKQGADYARDFIRLLSCYDKLDGEAATTRAFSSICFHDSKRFEREFQSEFLRAAARFHPALAEYSALEEPSDRELLAFLGIDSHPELFLLSGLCSLTTSAGKVDISPLFPHGIALPGSVVDEILAVHIQRIKRIILIENMTNYNEFLRTEICPDELVVYHGGFASPKKRQLLHKIAGSLHPETGVYFWADIDLGGFQMFALLQELFPQLTPMRMAAEDVTRLAPYGLARKAPYLQKLQAALAQRAYPLFDDAIQMILHYGVTIEQEAFYIR